MENQEAKQLISDSKNIYLIPSEGPEAIISALALFYTLKDLGKNVNLLIDTLPENLQFLAPSLDFISYPKNFVLSIPNSVAKISQIYYEKNNDALKIHLTLENGNIKKDNIAFYFAEVKPDLIIAVGVKDFTKEMSTKLDSFGFLLDSPILNIDTLTGSVQVNQKFGKINLLGNFSLTETVYDLIKPDKSPEGHFDGPATISPKANLGGESANCLLTGLVLYTGNFKNKVTADVFQTASALMKVGADLKLITDNLKI